MKFWVYENIAGFRGWEIEADTIEDVEEMLRDGSLWDNATDAITEYESDSRSNYSYEICPDAGEPREVSL